MKFVKVPLLLNHFQTKIKKINKNMYSDFK